MKKKILPLAIAAAMAPGFAAAADVSGFADIVYTIADDQAAATTSPSPSEGKFGASGEVDFIASPADGVTVRIDVDLDLTPGTSGSADLEQAFFAWNASEGVTVLGGVFNNPVGMECGDAPCMWGTNGGVVGNILNHQTALDGNNVAGLAVAGAVGPATVTFGFLNDLQHADEENSIALVVNATPIDGLDLELGFASQADAATHTTQATGLTTAEDVVDFNISYAIPGVEGLSVALDYLAPGKVIDSAHELMINYGMDAWGVGLRLEEVSYEATGSQDTERMTIHASYQIASNLVAILEVADGDYNQSTDAANFAAEAGLAGDATGIAQGTLTTLELIATF